MNAKSDFTDFLSEFQHKLPDLQQNLDANARIKMYYYHMFTGREFFINLLIYTTDSNKTYKIAIYPNGPEAYYNNGLELPETMQVALENWLLSFDVVQRRQSTRAQHIKLELIEKTHKPEKMHFTGDA